MIYLIFSTSMRNIFSIMRYKLFSISKPQLIGGTYDDRVSPGWATNLSIKKHILLLYRISFTLSHWGSSIPKPMESFHGDALTFGVNFSFGTSTPWDRFGVKIEKFRGKLDLSKIKYCSESVMVDVAYHAKTFSNGKNISLLLNRL